MDKITITSGDYDLMCAKIQFLENENNKLKGYIEGLKEQLRIGDVSQQSELLPSTCPSCGSYEWSYHLSIDKMKCLDCGNCG
jgi:ferredoxin-like protein FixX